MAGKKEPGPGWRQTSVLVRADIFTQAHEQGIDISDACNRALADRLGIDYRQQHLDNVPVPPPVIIAKDGGLPVVAATIPTADKTHLPPVINADDPTAAGTITRIKRQPVKKPAHDIPVPKTGIPEDKNTASPPKVPDITQGKKSPKTAPKKTGKGDALRKFIATRIIREDTDDAIIGKEEFYQIFSRWCRDQKISPVPDGKAVTVALKNQFAFREKVVDGKSAWVNLRAR
jgi:hypothetical protein